MERTMVIIVSAVLAVLLVMQGLVASPRWIFVNEEDEKVAQDPATKECEQKGGKCDNGECMQNNECVCKKGFKKNTDNYCAEPEECRFLGDGGCKEWATNGIGDTSYIRHVCKTTCDPDVGKGLCQAECEKYPQCKLFSVGKGKGAYANECILWKASCSLDKSEKEVKDWSLYIQRNCVNKKTNTVNFLSAVGKRATLQWEYRSCMKGLTVKGYVRSLYECAAKCPKSQMFVFGRANTKGCTKNGCKCYCVAPEEYATTGYCPSYRTDYLDIWTIKE